MVAEQDPWSEERQREGEQRAKMIYDICTHRKSNPISELYYFWKQKYSSKFHGKESIVTSVHPSVRCGTLECLLETQYLNLSLKNFIPKENWLSRAESKWSIQLLHMKYNNWQLKKKCTKKGNALAQRELLIWEPRTLLNQQRKRLPWVNQ